MVQRGAVLREKPEVDARLLARQIPPEARVVALAFAPGQEKRAAHAAESVAAGLGRRREHTLLASCESAPSALDLLLGGADSPGLWQAIRGEARLTEVAVRPRERLYVYLPAGFSPPATGELAGDERFAAFVGRARIRGGTLLLFAPEALLAHPAFGALLDGYIALGRLQAAHAAGGGPPEVARLDFGSPEVVEPEEDGGAPDAGEASVAEEPTLQEPAFPVEAGSFDAASGEAEDEGPAPLLEGAPEEARETVSEREASEPTASQPLPGQWTGAWRQHRGTRRFPLVRALVGLLVVALLGVGWWALARQAASPAPFGVEPLPANDNAPSVTLEALEAAAENAPEAPYSVLIASYAAADDASARLARLRRADGGLFFAAPTPVRGAIYHRVFAGARADGEAGRSLMEELVRAGRKDEASAWDVRPARLAFRIAIVASEGEARAEAERLEADGVPAYVLGSGDPEGGGERAWQVYAGAYESEAAAGPMAALLERAGVPAELVVRRGEAR